MEELIPHEAIREENEDEEDEEVRGLAELAADDLDTSNNKCKSPARPSLFRHCKSPTATVPPGGGNLAKSSTPRKAAKGERITLSALECHVGPERSAMSPISTFHPHN